MKSMVHALAFALALGATSLGQGCAPASQSTTHVNVAAEERAIAELEESWDRYWEAGDLETLVDAFYAPDAVLAATSEPDHRGRAAILENYRALKADANLVLDYRPESLWVAGGGDMAVRTGVFSNRYTDPATGRAANDSGRYLVVYRKQDGRWRAVIDMETSQAS